MPNSNVGSVAINPSLLPEGHADIWAAGIMKVLRSGYDVWVVGPGYELAKKHLELDRAAFNERERQRIAKMREHANRR